MVGTFRPRRLAAVALLGALALGLAACGGPYPNSTFSHNSEYNTAIDALWNTLLMWGTIVFVLVEAALVYVIVKFRRRSGAPDPAPVHGNTTLEIAWTAIPAVILIFIAIPTVRTIFRTQAKAPADALQVEVIGHQWWWEFRYPQYTATRSTGKIDTLVTANELYLQNGRTVNFTLRTKDVLHSFWIPSMGGKRDLITNRTNYLWFTPNADLGSTAWSGACAEYCGTSHANMRFRIFTVLPEEFAQWTAHQLRPAMFPPVVAAPAAVPAPATAIPVKNVAKPVGKAADSATTAAPQTAEVEPPTWVFPMETIKAKYGYTVPNTPIPPGVEFDDKLLAAGDAQKGMQAFNMACIGCHTIKGNPAAMSPIGPNLTHIGTRHTIAGSLYENDGAHLARWIKNAPVMKPGSIMPTLGQGMIDPITKKKGMMAMYTDQQIADIVAYLQALK